MLLELNIVETERDKAGRETKTVGEKHIDREMHMTMSDPSPFSILGRTCTCVLLMCRPDSRTTDYMSIIPSVFCCCLVTLNCVNNPKFVHLYQLMAKTLRKTPTIKHINRADELILFTWRRGRVFIRLNSRDNQHSHTLRCSRCCACGHQVISVCWMCRGLRLDCFFRIGNSYSFSWNSIPACRIRSSMWSPGILCQGPWCWGPGVTS